MLQFEDFDIALNVFGSIRRIAKIKFSKDGSLYVFFPGFANTEGIVCRPVLRAGVVGQTTLDLTVWGKVTTHLVKYAHHPDGEAHFSQDGKVKTEIRRRAVPLDQQRGHLFTIQVQDFGSFPALNTPRKRQLTFNLPDSVRAIKITGWRFGASDFQLPEGAQVNGGPKGVQLADGVTRYGFFVSPPGGTRFDDIVLFLSVEEIPWMSEDKAAHLIFMGGFDPVGIALNSGVDTEFLAFAYPCSDYSLLNSNIGSIDFIAK
jgi:hypothetical protein